MKDLYLKFPDQSTADVLLYDQVPTASDPITTTQRQKYMNTDVIGIIYEGGEWDQDGHVIIPPVALEGWHVNVRLMPDEVEAPLEPYQVQPRHPRRVWA
jgi:hypothetical protein